jgi:esterase/lipase superfamily enzyme
MEHPIFIATNRKRLRVGSIVSELFSADEFENKGKVNREITCLSVNGDLSHFMKSEELFKEAQDYMMKNKKNCVFFCHGFNNTFGDAIKAAKQISDLYDVVVIMFTWPSDITGVPFEDYREKKEHAMQSCSALDRVLGKMYKLIKTSRKDCHQSISAIYHSMGNYLLQGAVNGQGHYNCRKQLFDNIILAQADINAEGSEEFINKLDVRGEVYVTINKRDAALRFSQMKFGEKQRRRRGCTTKYLNGECVYLDFTSQRLGNEHTFFTGIEDSSTIEMVHSELLNGGSHLDCAIEEVVAEKLYRIN